MNYQMCRVAYCFNCVIELKQKMLILSKFLTKNHCSCSHDNWIFYKKYFWNTELCCCEDLMTKCLLFTEKLLVFKYCFIFIVLGLDTSSQSSRGGQHRGSTHSVKGRSPPVCSEQ